MLMHCTLYFIRQNPNTNKWELICWHLQERLSKCPPGHKFNFARRICIYLHLTGWWLRLSTNMPHCPKPYSNIQSEAVKIVPTVKCNPSQANWGESEKTQPSASSYKDGTRGVSQSLFPTSGSAGSVEFVCVCVKVNKIGLCMYE